MIINIERKLPSINTFEYNFCIPLTYLNHFQLNFTTKYNAQFYINIHIFILITVVRVVKKLQKIKTHPPITRAVAGRTLLRPQIQRKVMGAACCARMQGAGPQARLAALKNDTRVRLAAPEYGS